MSGSTNCRGCFAFIDSATSKCTNLSEKVDCLGVSLLEILCDYIGVKVESGIVCHSCYQNFITLYKFQRQVYETDQRFKEIEEEVPVELIVKVEPELMDGWMEDGQESIEEEGVEPLMPIVEETNKEDFSDYKKNDNGFYECSLCPAQFNLLVGVKLHQKYRHLDMIEKTFACEDCPEKFHTALILKEHVREVHMAKQYMCDICGKSYDSTLSLNTHMEDCHLPDTSEKAPATCTVCGMYFSDHSTMLKHSRIVHAPKEDRPHHVSVIMFQCSICGYRGKDKSALGRHMETHDKTVEIKCSYCSKIFYRDYNLKRHVREMHTNGTRNHSCHLCSKSFSRRATLRNHLLTHNANRPFKCEHCPKDFTAKRLLQKHTQRIHSGGYPTACGLCGKVLLNRLAYDRHRRDKCSNIVYSCLYCNKEFELKKSLTHHIREKHSDDG